MASRSTAFSDRACVCLQVLTMVSDRACACLQVLTMEYVPGVKINQGKQLDRMGVDRTLLAQRAVESYLQQLLTFGFFHAGTGLLLRLSVLRLPGSFKRFVSVGVVCV